MWTEELKARFMKTDPAAYGHFIGVRVMAPKIKPINPNSKICGPAYTVKTYGKDHYAMFKAIEDAPEGSVIVIDRAGDDIYAPVGEFVARGARAKGLAGFVIDGMATDSAYIRTFEDFPVFCSGLSAVTCNCWGITGETQIDVCCGGAVVHPGDIILGDCDGLVVMPSEGYEEMLERAEAMAAREAKMRAAYESGQPLPASGRPSVKVLEEANVQAIINGIRSGELAPDFWKK